MGFCLQFLFFFFPFFYLTISCHEPSFVSFSYMKGTIAACSPHTCDFTNIMTPTPQPSQSLIVFCLVCYDLGSMLYQSVCLSVYEAMAMNPPTNFRSRLDHV